MESLCNYGSDDDNSPSPKREVTTKLTRTNGMEADANYEQVTMDMSEQESNHSSTKSPQPKEQTSSSTSSPVSVSRTSRSDHTRKHENHSDTKTSSSDEEKIKNHSRHRRNKSRDRHNKKHSRRSRSRSSGRKRSRRSRSHSRNKKRSRRSHSRSRSRSERKNGSSRKSSPYSRHESKNHKRHNSRSKSKEKYASSHNYFLEKKANNKRQILDKLGIELKVPSIGNSSLPSTAQVTPQQLLQKSMEAQVEKVKVQTGIELPSYYNPVAVNPNKYAEQIQKRKLLWGNKQTNDVVKKVEESKPVVITANKTATIWQSTKFGDQDGKVTAKFKRLMGIKEEIGANNQTSQPGQSKDIIKKQEEMFSSMESQYEVARMATHTHRGLGLGFGTFQQR